MECLSEKRAYFADPLEIYFEIGKLINKLDAGTCENQQLLQDYKTYGIREFSFSIIVSGFEYSDEKKRKQALEDAKNSWQGELY